MKNSNDQQIFYDLAMSGKNIFLSGKAGTGKSFITKKLISDLSKMKKNVVVVAPTGVAANNIKGATIHSVFSLPVNGMLEWNKLNFLKSEKRNVISKIDVLIIDEISMVRPDILDGIHLTMKKNGCKGLDEIQVIFVGDMAQLNPVMDDNMRTMIMTKYQGLDFTFSGIYNTLKCEEIELNEVLRQSNKEFVDNLNIIRNGKKSEYFRKFVSGKPRGIVLAPHNSTVKRYNKIGLDSIDSELLIFYAKIEGKAKETDFNFESKLELKEGCKIMYLVNSKNNNLVNGTIGTLHIDDVGNLYIRVGNIDHKIEKYKQNKEEYVWNEEKDELELIKVGSIEQYPIKLAYAVSIHKSQGLTFDEVTLDLAQPCFAKGQLYVGLSRVTSPEGLTIITK